MVKRSWQGTDGVRLVFLVCSEPGGAAGVKAEVSRSECGFVSKKCEGGHETLKQRDRKLLKKRAGARQDDLVGGVGKIFLPNVQAHRQGVRRDKMWGSVPVKKEG